MSLKSNSDSLFAIITLLNDAELRTLADRCQNLVAARERLKREGLRQELMGNLQKAIEDVLHNGFHLVIENTNNPEWVVNFNPNEDFHIEMK